MITVVVLNSALAATVILTLLGGLAWSIASEAGAAPRSVGGRR